MIFYSEIPQSHMGNHREAKVQYLTNNTHISRYILKNFQIFTYIFFSGHTFSIFLLIFEYFTKNIQYKIIMYLIVKHILFRIQFEQIFYQKGSLL